MSFHIMQRVAFYSNGVRLTGHIATVIAKRPSGNVYKVLADPDEKGPPGEENYFSVHEKQCRKLVKKKRREFWLVKAYKGDRYCVSLSEPNLPGIYSDIIKVREVKK